ncbi:hypothetical protein B0H66DRAFT_479829 [Apodospora peruviana]|uniref:Nudix hydrolase domain-containing protein n=1 Tax=Apodospora peruviana TaxID=516989 RepID=A0AAE0HZE2_9PEZI|nr:hypothetical protein B0H66DRAFT_479829 [Apodospora peruviana]
MSTDTTGFKKRSVVSNFIFNFDTPDGKPRVALFKRSGKVSTYQHHLAPISGSIEYSDPSPLAAAWREINEETTLTPASLALIRQGKSYTFSDPAIRREWTIHPFAFRLKSGTSDANKIKIDWEHSGWDWYDPATVEDSTEFGGVPRLAESLRRVWFEKDLGSAAGKILADGLDKLAHDFTSGARQMAGDALRILRDVIAALDKAHDVDRLKWWTNVRFAAWHIWKNGRESMGAAIMSVLVSALAWIEQTISQQQSPHPPATTAIDILNKRIAARQDSAGKVSHAFATYLETTFASRLTSKEPLSILTLSESSTITHAIHHLAQSSGFILDLRILESRPLFEGVALAASLAKSLPSFNEPTTSSPVQKKHKITLYTDASAGLAVQNVDIVVIGADRISDSGDVSNKTGSLPAVLGARYVTYNNSEERHAAKIVVLAEKEKVAPYGERFDQHVVEDGDPGQVTQAWEVEGVSERVKDAARVLREYSHNGEKKGVEVEMKNVAFEWCSSETIDVYINENGQWSRDDIAEHSKKLKEEEKRIFGSL